MNLRKEIIFIRTLLLSP